MDEPDRKFGLQPFGEAVELNLEEHEYRRIGSAKRYILDALQFEENYLLVLKAYFELERNSNDETLKSLLFRNYSYDDRQDSILQKDLKSLAFLAAFRSYRDRFPKFNGQTRPGSAYAKLMSTWDQSLLDCPEFWACEHLRHFAIHHGSSIQLMASGGSWDEARERHEAYTHFKFSVDELERFLLEEKRKIEGCKNLREKYGEKINLFIVVRKGFSELGRIHNKIRKFIREEYKASDQNYRSAIEKMEMLLPGCRTGYAVCLESGEVSEKVSLFCDLPDRTERLVKRVVLENIEKHYVTSQLD
ncbi:hypothetical protein [Maricaulis sp. W15]|uniref:hypothetical protein n=1 Tax=Maricaulis sp. W15 TaxID=1772333 RepID=UPI000ACD6759|nr:hypothetical protein [Maricaulis sp. W15]